MTGLEWFIANNNLIEYLSPTLFENLRSLLFVNLNYNKIKVIEVDFAKLPAKVKVLGMGNTCMDFFINKEVNGAKLNQLVKQKCARKA
jgi:Leucine rich repeat